MWSWVPFAKTYKLTCPDKSVRIIYKNVNDAFPLFIEGWEANLAGKVKEESGIEANIVGEYKTKIDGILVALDQFNSSIMMDFRVAYVIFTGDPCRAIDRFERMVQNVMEKRDFIRELKILLDSLITLAREQPDNRDAFIILFGKIADRLSPQAAVDETKLQIRVAREEAMKMVRGQDDL